MHSFRFSKLWLTLGWILIAVVIFLSLWPNPPQLFDFELSDKLSHIIVYMILLLWFANIYLRTSHRLLLGLAFFAMGICLEILQSQSEYRAFSYADMLANGLGILIALCLARTRLAAILMRFDTWLLSLGQR